MTKYGWHEHGLGSGGGGVKSGSLIGESTNKTPALSTIGEVEQQREHGERHQSKDGKH